MESVRDQPSGIIAAGNVREGYDVIVAGSGAAGLTAALAAAVAGARVLVVEAAPLFGGASAVSGGQVWVPGHHLREAGTSTDRQGLRSYCVDHSKDRPEAMIDAFLDAAPAMVRFVEKHTPLRFTPMSSPDSLTPPDQTEGWNLEPAPLAAGPFTDWQEWVWSPPYPAVLTNDEVAESRMIFGGAPPGELIGRRMSAGEVTLGVALVVGLLRGCLDARIDLVRSARLSALDIADGGVRGVVLDDGEGTERRVRVRRGVVLATGGFEHDRKLVENLLAIPAMVPASPPVASGDGLRLAARAGAGLAYLSEAWYWPLITSGATWDGTSAERADIMLAERALPHVIWVNSAGRRFVNEAGHNCAWAFADLDTSAGRPANLPAYAIGDGQYRARYPLAGAGPDKPWPDGVTVADTLAGLAGQLGIDPDALADTVEAFNDDVRAGHDSRHGRGETAYERYLGDPTAPHPNLGTIAEPPYFALPITPGAVGTKGGPVIDEHGRVLDWTGHPITGLFAAGNAAAAPLGPAILSSGMTLGLAMTFGLLAGTTAAAGANDEH